MLRGRDVDDIDELTRQGLSIRAISRSTGHCRKTITKYLRGPKTFPSTGHDRPLWVSWHRSESILEDAWRQESGTRGYSCASYGSAGIRQLHVADGLGSDRKDSRHEQWRYPVSKPRLVARRKWTGDTSARWRATGEVSPYGASHSRWATAGP